jgi:tetratricopeptide (TPR) repeat protein
MNRRAAREHIRGGGLALALAVGGPRAAFADPPPPTSSASDARALEQFRAGVSRYQDGDLDGAAAAFAQAYELSGDFRLLYNLAQVQQELQDHAEALRSLELYLARGGAQIEAGRREEVARTRSELERRAASLRVTTNVAGARLWIDGIPAGSLPSAATWLNPGVHRLLVAKDSHAPAIETLTILPGERRRLDMPLRETRPPAPAGTTTAAVAVAAPAERTPLWISMGATGTSAALAIGFAVLTRSADARLERELERYPADTQSLDAARSRVSTLAAVTDVCIGVSALAAGLSLYFALSSGGEDDTALGHVELDVAPGGSSLSFQGEF